MSNFTSTLSRLLGKKNKDKSEKSLGNGKLSKSSSNLAAISISSSNINEASPMEYNRITPLPVVTTNAAFEQTFRITVSLPKDQLYVTRLGARVALSKLLELVCENKQLDGDKYEFRNPVDPSQIFDCSQTIGAVGLSEIRLCLKSEPYDSFNADELLKMQRSNIIRESLSSSEYSSRNSKSNILQQNTTSPYSSSNSLNSMDSSGVHCPRSLVSSSPQPNNNSAQAKTLAAPPRKKRAAPRPPSQMVIPERAALITENGSAATEQTIEQLKQTAASLPRKDYHSSTPNLSLANKENDLQLSAKDCNGNIDEQVEQRNARNLLGGSVQNLSSPMVQSLPEPSPRKRLIQIKKKAAPIAPASNRNSQYADDNISLASSTPSQLDTPDSMDISELDSAAKHFSPRTPDSIDINELQENMLVVKQQPQPMQREQAAANEKPEKLPTPLPRVTTTTLLNVSCSPISATAQSPNSKTLAKPANSNISKVLLNRTPTPEPRSLSAEPPEMEASLVAHIASLKQNDNSYEDDDAASKQADSGIGEPIPSPVPDSLNSEESAQEVKCSFESSSDDDDVKVYNFKLGTTINKAAKETVEPQPALAELKLLVENQSDVSATSSGVPTEEPTPTANTESSSWNFSIPISPPPNFADKEAAAPKTADEPITPIIKERPLLNFESIRPQHQLGKPAISPSPLQSPTTPLNELVEELNSIIQEKRVDTLIRKPEEASEIEAAKPNTLSNFSIAAISSNAQPGSKEAEQSAAALEEDKLYRKRGSISSSNGLFKQRRSVSRSDSFHSTALEGVSAERRASNGSLNSRSSSHLSLNKLEHGMNGYSNGRRSSSELSIGESPSLQSLEVMKTILNSRKNSLNNSGSENESASQAAQVLLRPLEGKRFSSEDSKITSVELKPKLGSKTLLVTEEKVQQAKAEPAAQQVPKVYRYSGPPSINFSTWSERPKVKVAIKNEGDYIFGGKQAAAAGSKTAELTAKDALRSNRMTMPASSYNNSFQAKEGIKIDSRLIEVLMQPQPKPKPPAVAPKPESPTKRMGIPEQEFKVPITVKPLPDVSVEAQLPQEEQQKLEAKVEIKTAAEMQSQARQINSNSLPRSNSNRYSLPAHKSDKNAAEQSTAAAPFGQNTLRRTGFKEKMLAKEQQQQQQQQQQQHVASVENNHNSKPLGIEQPKLKPAASLTNSNKSNFYGSFSQNSLERPKLKSSISVANIINQNSLLEKPKLKPTPPASLQLKLQAANASSENSAVSTVSLRPVLNTPKSAPAAPPAPTPPPPPMSLLKSRSVASTPVANNNNADPRDQLLAAIRNFKREELSKV